MAGQSVETENYEELSGSEKHRRFLRMEIEFLSILTDCCIEGSVETVEDVIQLYWSFQEVRGIPYNSRVKLRMFESEAYNRSRSGWSMDTPRGKAVHQSYALLKEAISQVDEESPMKEEPEYGARVIYELVESKLFDKNGVSKAKVRQ